MSSYDEHACCPRFDPEPGDEEELSWDDRRFVKDRVTSILAMV